MMRLTILTLLLFTRIAAFSQSAAPTTISTDKLEHITPSFMQQPIRDFSKLPPGYRITNAAPLGTILLPRVEGVQRLDSAKIDPKMIIHPPQSSIGVQPPGTPVAQNEYPNLRMMPIESSSLKALPTQWPLLQVKAIPVQWPKCEVDPAHRATLSIGQTTEK